MNTNNANVDNAVLRKIKKLWALGQNNSSAEEAQSAIAKAQALMAEHGLSMGEVDDVKLERTKEVGEEFFGEVGRTSWWRKSLAMVIADNFRCYCYLGRQAGGTRLKFMGLKEDVEIAIDVYEFAEFYLQFHANNYMKERKKIGIGNIPATQIKNDFILGFIKGLGDKLEEQKQQNGWALVLAKDALVVQKHEDKHVTKGRASTVRARGDQGARQAGYEKGNSFNKPQGQLN